MPRDPWSIAQSSAKSVAMRQKPPKVPQEKGHVLPQEQGFVLIATIWLLVLGGAIIAVVMLRTMTVSRAAVAQGTDLRDRLALDGAIDSVVADILFNGNRSRWAQLPASGTVDVGGSQINVAVSSENGRLDLNAAEPALIDTALRGFGVAAGPRTAFINQLLERRATKQPLRSRDEVERLIAVAGAQSGGVCLSDMLTVSAGLATPQVDQMPTELARALGQPGASGPAPMSPGGAVRVFVWTGQGMALGAVVRPIGIKDVGAQVLDRFLELGCRAL
jgi:hypothetical protein